MKVFKLGLVLMLLVTTACSQLVLPSGVPQTTGTATQALPLAPPSTTAPGAQATATPSGPLTLRVWVPPQFDPAADSDLGRLLQARLNEFSQRRPDVRLEVRVKAVDGPGGLLDSLTNASAAAPLALPDLIALTRPLLETAALKGLLHPFDSLTKTMEDADWYEYARQMARLQNSTFGLPFAGDPLLLVYQSALVSQPPASWVETLQTSGVLAFPAADPQALFSLLQYQSGGGAVRDDQGRPFLDANILGQVFDFYQKAEQTEVMPYWLTQFQTDDQVWEAFQDRRAAMTVTWASRYLTEMLTGTLAAPLPTPDGKPFTLTTGWVWALASNQPERQALATQLAEFLTDSSFLAQWTEAAGYLPSRPSSLDAWTDQEFKPLASQVLLSAQIYPSADILSSLGPALQAATVQVLKQQSDPLTAAQAAVDSLSGP